MALTVADSYWMSGDIDENSWNLSSYEIRVENFIKPSFGAYVAQSLDAEGNLIFQTFVNTYESTCERPVTNNDPCEKWTYFTMQVPANGDIKKIIAKKHTGEIVFEKSFSQYIPEVHFTSQLSGVQSGEILVSWAGSDTDGDELKYQLWYSSDDGKPNTWKYISLGKLTGYSGSVKLPTSWLAGSLSQSRLRLTVTDGANGSDVISNPFLIANRVPELTLLYPESNELHRKGERIAFRASVREFEYEKLPDSNFVWSSSKDGVFGYGQSLDYSGLSAGTHTITVTVNTPGGTASKTVENITVAEKKPEIVLTVGDGTQLDLACNEVKIEVKNGDAPLQEFFWWHGKKATAAKEGIDVGQSPINLRYTLMDGGEFIGATVTDKVDLQAFLETTFIPTIVCPPPTPSGGGN